MSDSIHTSNADSQAFPSFNTHGETRLSTEGLSKREYVATALMQSVLHGASASPELLDNMLQLASTCAVKAADALLAELSKAPVR